VKARISGQNSIVWYEGGGAASVFKTGALNRSATLPARSRETCARELYTIASGG
jgi:hypothetical protein